MATRAVDSCEIIVNDEAIGHEYENVTLQVKPVDVPSPMASIIGAPLIPKRASKSPVKNIYNINHLFQRRITRSNPQPSPGSFH